MLMTACNFTHSGVAEGRGCRAYCVVLCIIPLRFSPLFVSTQVCIERFDVTPTPSGELGRDGVPSNGEQRRRLRLHGGYAAFKFSKELISRVMDERIRMFKAASSIAGNDLKMRQQLAEIKHRLRRFGYDIFFHLPHDNFIEMHGADEVFLQHVLRVDSVLKMTEKLPARGE